MQVMWRSRLLDVPAHRAEQTLKMRDAKVYVTSFNRPNLQYSVVRKTTKALDAIVLFIRKIDFGRDLECAVRAAVVDEDHLEAQPDGLQRGHDCRVQRPDAFLLVEQWDDDR